MKILEQINTNGFINEKPLKSMNIVDDINKLKKEKNAIILGHFYQNSEIQDVADFIGDSLALSQKAASTDADIIIFAGVHFMAETAKILSPEKKVILPDLNAGCSLADSCTYEKFEDFVRNHPDHTVISYVNTTAAIKTLTDIVCTSSNALQIIESLPEDQKIIFAPDKNLGNYIKSVSGRDMLLWDGACHVHEKFSLEKILEIKKIHSNAKVLAHPECEKPVLLISDYIGSTSSLLNFTITDSANEFIVATESGIIHQMQLKNPGKLFIPAPPIDSTCGCNDCEFMKLITLPKIWASLKYELPEVLLEESVMNAARKPIVRMLEISEKLGL